MQACECHWSINQFCWIFHSKWGLRKWKNLRTNYIVAIKHWNMNLPSLLVDQERISCCIASAWPPASQSFLAAVDPVKLLPVEEWEWPLWTSGPFHHPAASSSSSDEFVLQRAHLCSKLDSLQLKHSQKADNDHTILLIYKIQWNFRLIWLPNTHIVRACLPRDTCAGGTAGTCVACTCPFHTVDCSCKSTEHF